MRPFIVWFRRDLRVNDNPSLFHACATGAPVIPLFIVDREIVKRLPSDGAVFDFQAEALRDLAHSLSSLGGKLIVRHGEVMAAHRKIIEETNPAGIYFNRDYEPHAIERDAKVVKLYESCGVDVKTFKDIVLQEPAEVLTGDGRPYVVFTPYAKAWKRCSSPSPLKKPSRFRTPSLTSGAVMGASELRRATVIPRPAFRGGEGEANKRWRYFLAHLADGYRHTRDFPGSDGTSRMSAYLRFGCISVRQMVNDCRNLESSAGEEQKRSVDAFIDELIWREFYQAVLFHFPRLLESNYRQEFDRPPWRFDEKMVNAWRDGRTGFPLVDAGMRELQQTGWMHNRVRMVVASFLTKDLMHDWRLGEKVFEEKLLDIETASNNGGWQWSASTGVDPRPLRVFNPRLQSERFDPDGTYIKRFVVELRNVPARFIHAPHEMTPLQQADSGCVIGKDYPAPIVDHREASEAYKKAFARVKGRG